jgi:hypothetical protein
MLLILTPAHAGGVLGNLFADIGKDEVKEGPFVNSYQLEEVLKALGKRPVDENSAPNILYYGNVKHGSVADKPGYSAGVTAQIRAYGKTIQYYDSKRTKIYGLPAIFYFPDDPKKNPVLVQVHTINIIPETADKILANSDVNIVFKELNGEKDWTIVYGQTVLENTKTKVTLDGNSLLIASEIDISKMDTEDALDYFYAYQGKISSFNATVASKKDEIEEDWEEEQAELREQEYERQEQEQEVLFKKTWATIPDAATFESLASQAHISRRIENPVSELGHWEYEYKDENMPIEVINYGTYFEKLYLLKTRDSAPKAQKEKMYAELKKLAEDESPKGASSIDVGESRYQGLTQIVVTYSLGKSFKGKIVNDYTKGFDEFVSEIYSDAQKIVAKYAPRLEDMEFTTLSKAEFIEVVNDNYDGVEDKSDAYGAKGYWKFYEKSKSGGAGRLYVIGNFDDHMLLSFIFHNFSKSWTVEEITEAAERLKDEIDDEELLDADSSDVEVITYNDNPTSVWIQFKINYKKPGMFSSGGLKGSIIRDKYQTFKTELVPQLSKRLIAHAQAVYNESR